MNKLSSPLVEAYMEKRCVAFILGYSSLAHAPWGPISIWFIGRVLIFYHRPHTCLGLGLLLYAFE